MWHLLISPWLYFLILTIFNLNSLKIFNNLNFCKIPIILLSMENIAAYTDIEV